MKYHFVSLFALCAVALNRASGYRCQGTTGNYRFFDGDEEITPEQFSCLKITRETPSTLQVLPPVQADEPRRCPAVQDGKASIKVKYERVEVNTGIMCTLTCKVDFGRYHCTEKANNGECVCAPQQPQVVVKPVASELGPGPLLGGQSDLNGPQEQTCADKPVGFQFPDAVPCVSIRADVVKERVHFIMGKTDDCTVRTGEAPETRYMETTPDNVGLQGCVYVCKMKAPKCTGPKAEGKCRCASPGISKQLVAMSQLAGTTRLVEKCTSDKGCEPCGFCKNSVCELKKEAHLGSNCDCGKICPAKDYRLRKTGASISCEPNFSMDCMARPDWMDMKTAPNGKATSFLDGTEVPDLCTAGPTDASDMCGCAPGYEERLVSNDTERVCVKPSPLPAPTKPQDAMPEEGDVAPVEILPEAGGTIGKD